MKRWPPVVQRVLKETHSPKYDLKMLSRTTREETLKLIEQMASSFRQRVIKLNNNNNNNKRWGFKAPVSMYMIPFWAKVFPKATFVHVVIFILAL
jgi:hypothetical protein